MNSSSHSFKQNVSGFHMLSGWHANPSRHISAGVFLLWLFKMLHGGQHARLIQLRGQQARVIEMLPFTQREGGKTRAGENLRSSEWGSSEPLTLSVFSNKFATCCYRQIKSQMCCHFMYSVQKSPLSSLYFASKEPDVLAISFKVLLSKSYPGFFNLSQKHMT